MSVRLNLYNDIKAILIAIEELTPDGLIHHVDIWNSQAKEWNIEQHKQARYPQVFVEFEKANYLEPKQKAYNKNIRGEQNYICNITLHVYTKVLTDETESFIDKEPLLESIKYALKGTQGTNYGPLRLISDDYDRDHGNMYESQLIFSTLVQEPGIYDNQVEAHNHEEQQGVWNDIALDMIREPERQFLVDDLGNLIVTDLEQQIEI